MKKILWMSIMACGVLFAEGAAKSNQIKTMQTLESALETIQKGFVYNNVDLVNGGIEDLKSSLVDVNAFVINTDANTSKDFNPKAYAVTEAASMIKLATKMGDLYKDGKHDEALDTYTKTLKRCVVCHKIIRKW